MNSDIFMDTDEAIIKPLMGEKPPQLDNRCVMVANQPDLDYLERLFKTKDSKSRRIMMSRLSYGHGPALPGFIGPFIGAPYAVILLESLIAWGITEFVFFGWCGAVSESVRIGDIIIPDQSFIDDGTSQNYMAAPSSAALPSASIQSRLKSFLNRNDVRFHEGSIWSTDAIFRETKEKIGYYQKKNTLAVEMEAAALFSAGSFRNVDVGCILLVSDELSSYKWKPGFKHPVFKERRCQALELISRFWNDRNHNF